MHQYLNKSMYKLNLRMRMYSYIYILITYKMEF